MKNEDFNRVLTITAAKNGWCQFQADSNGDYSFTINTDLLSSSTGTLTLSVYRFIDNKEDLQRTDTLDFHRGQGVVTKVIHNVLPEQSIYWTQNITQGSYPLMISRGSLENIKDEVVTRRPQAEYNVASHDYMTGRRILTGTPAVGDIIYMGWYEQDNNPANGRERI